MATDIAAVHGNAAWQKMRQMWDQSAASVGAAAGWAVGAVGAGAAAWAEAPAAGQHLYGGRMTDTRRYEAVQVTQVNTWSQLATTGHK